MTTDVSNSDDMIDSRDVRARIEELESERSDLADAMDAEDYQLSAKEELEDWDEENAAELKSLHALEEQASGYADWDDGATLIRDSYFKDYAMQLAEDLGSMPTDTWPLRCIDWDQAASELQQDYTSVDFDGITYWIR